MEDVRKTPIRQYFLTKKADWSKTYHDAFVSIIANVLRFVKSNKDEIIFAALFISTVTANKLRFKVTQRQFTFLWAMTYKISLESVLFMIYIWSFSMELARGRRYFHVTTFAYVLSELHFTVPTVFQGWHTFTCVLMLTALVKFEKCPSKITTLDKKSLYLILPGFACFAVSLVAGSKGLAELPVPVFCAILSLYPAILILSDRKTDFWENSKQVCGSATICGTVVVILVMTLNPFNTEAYISLLAHVTLSVIYTLYMNWIDVDLSSTTKIYYRNLFSVIVLLPVSVYLDVIDLPRYFYWEFYLGCVLSGILGTFLQIATAKIESKGSYMNYQGRARLICSLIGHYLFFANVEPVIWLIIVINLIANSFLLSPDEKELECGKRSKLTLIVGTPHGRELDLEKTISVHLESQRSGTETECKERLIVSV